MGRLKAVVQRCWDCGHVHSGVKMKRARSCYRCELCGTFNDSFFAIYTVKTVIYDKPSILNNWTKTRRIYWSPVMDHQFEDFAIAWGGE